MFPVKIKGCIRRHQHGGHILFHGQFFRFGIIGVPTRIEFQHPCGSITVGIGEVTALGTALGEKAFYKNRIGAAVDTLIIAGCGSAVIRGGKTLHQSTVLSCSRMSSEHFGHVVERQHDLFQFMHIAVLTNNVLINHSDSVDMCIVDLPVVSIKNNTEIFVCNIIVFELTTKKMHHRHRRKIFHQQQGTIVVFETLPVFGVGQFLCLHQGY